MDIRGNLTELFRYTDRLGLVSGISNFFKVRLGNTNNISLKGFKNSFKLRKSSSDIMAFHQVFIDKQYSFDAGFVPRFIIDGGGECGNGGFIFRQRIP